MGEFKNKRGFIISFVGQDGAGKTTVSNIMMERLKEKHDVKRMYLGSGENYSSAIKRIYKRLDKNDNSVFFRDLFGMIFYLQVAKRCHKKSQLSRKMAEKGTIVFWDRCPQLQYEGINDGPKVASKFGNSENIIIRLLCPYFQKKEMFYLGKAVNVQPDIVLKLHLSVEESMRRKPDNDINKIIKKHMIVENLRFPGSKILDIDATQALDKEIEQISTYIEDFSLNNFKRSDSIRQEFLTRIQGKDNIEHANVQHSNSQTIREKLTEYQTK